MCENALLTVAEKKVPRVAAHAVRAGGLRPMDVNARLNYPALFSFPFLELFGTKKGARPTYRAGAMLRNEGSRKPTSTKRCRFFLNPFKKIIKD